MSDLLKDDPDCGCLTKLKREYLFIQGEKLKGYGRYDEAITLYLKSIENLHNNEIFPGLPMCLKSLALHFFEKKKYSTSLQFVKLLMQYHSSALRESEIIHKKITDFSSTYSQFPQTITEENFKEYEPNISDKSDSLLPIDLHYINTLFLENFTADENKETHSTDTVSLLQSNREIPKLNADQEVETSVSTQLTISAGIENSSDHQGNIVSSNATFRSLKSPDDTSMNNKIPFESKLGPSKADESSNCSDWENSKHSGQRDHLVVHSFNQGPNIMVGGNNRGDQPSGLTEHTLDYSTRHVISELHDEPKLLLRNFIILFMSIGFLISSTIVIFHLVNLTIFNGEYDIWLLKTINKTRWYYNKENVFKRIIEYYYSSSPINSNQDEMDSDEDYDIKNLS